MLYNLHDDLLPALQANEPKTWNAVRILLLRYAEGKHIVTLGPDTLKEIRANTTFGDAERRAADNLRGRLDDRAGLRAKALVQVDVVPDTVEEGWAKFGKHDMYNLRASSVEELDHAAATSVIAEGDADLTLYRRAAEARVRSHPEFRTLHLRDIALDGRIGSGGNMGAVITERAAQRAPLIAVVDSDKEAREGSAGSTLRAAQAAVVNAKRCPARHVELRARELENLLPKRLILAALSSANLRLDADQTRRIEEAERARLLFPNNDGNRYQEVKDRIDKNTLRRCAEHTLTLTPQQLAPLLFTDDDGTWDELTTLLAWWGCSNGKVRL